jgi:hypothetical protein
MKNMGHALLPDLTSFGIINRCYGQNTCWVNPTVIEALRVSKQHATLMPSCKAIAVNMAITYTCNLLRLCEKLYLGAPWAALYIVDGHYDLLVSLPLWAHSAGNSGAAIPGIPQAIWDGFKILNKRLGLDEVGQLLQGGLAIAQRATDDTMLPKVQLSLLFQCLSMLLWIAQVQKYMHPDHDQEQHHNC